MLRASRATPEVTTLAPAALESSDRARGGNASAAAGSFPLVALLTAGRDKPYALGLAAALVEEDVALDFIASAGINGPELMSPLVRVFNVRDQREHAGAVAKMVRVLVYYVRLMWYAASTPAPILHILWNNKFEWFDRTLLMLYYRALGKRLVFTAHNVNAGRRDGTDSWWNRWTLRIQYRLSDHIFVHTELMQRELRDDFGAALSRISVIPFGINNTSPKTALTAGAARSELGLCGTDKVLLFFGNIAPYKGLEFLIEAFIELSKTDATYRLIIAGKPKDCEAYWAAIRSKVLAAGLTRRVVEKIDYIPDERVEVYFKAADALILPYLHIFQSGVLFLGYSFGLPVIASDVGSLKEGIVEGRTGFVVPPGDATELARQIRSYFSSPLYQGLERNRSDIQNFANERFSWRKVGAVTRNCYQRLAPDCASN